MAPITCISSKRNSVCAIAALALSGCVVFTNTRSAVMARPPFSTRQFQVSVTEATVCVGRYWQSFAARPQQSRAVLSGSYWEVTTSAYEVAISTNTESVHVIGPVIEFEDRDGKAFARAYAQRTEIHDDVRRSVTLEAFNACELQPSQAPSSSTAIASASGVQPEPARPRQSGAAFRQVDTGWLITRIVSDSAAERAGLHVGDVITGINGREPPALSGEHATDAINKAQSPVILRLNNNNQVMLNF